MSARHTPTISIRLLLPWLFLPLLLPASLWAEAISLSPLPIMQQNPVMMRFFDPRPTTASVGKQGQQQLRLQTHYTSLFLADQLPQPNRYLADMELFIVDIGLRRSLGHHTDIDLTLPIIQPTSGVMDGFLHRYHRALNLPNGGREQRPNNQFVYSYRGQNHGWNNNARTELGNLQLTLRHQLSDRPWALLLGVKMPTAAHRRGWGSGNSDIALGAVRSWQKQAWFAHGEGWWILPFSRNDAGYAIRDYLRVALTLGRKVRLFSQPLHAMIQAQGGSSPYRSTIAALDQPPWLISFGLRAVSSTGQQWNASFVENISQASTQDFGISVGISIPLH